MNKKQQPKLKIIKKDNQLKLVTEDNQVLNEVYGISFIPNIINFNDLSPNQNMGFIGKGITNAPENRGSVSDFV